ncbi:hypothetical protein niasHS_016494 [Heterodera schachtii]|uniref:Uncharacterized protein n=1 Tax=Heterodera schachtii TaxID=97005 RepID=A0ABD2HTG9_HETSC
MIAQPQNLLLANQNYGKIFEEIDDAPEEVREFAQNLADQNKAMAKVIQKCEQNDMELAQIYYHLVESIDAINEGNEEGTVFDGETLEKVRKIAVEAVFLLAKHEENEQKSHQKQRERLRLILAGIGDGSIGPMRIMPKNSKSDGSSRNRRRRKKRNAMLIAILVVLVIIIVALISCYLGRACDGSSSASASAGASANKSASKSAISSKTEGAKK